MSDISMQSGEQWLQNLLLLVGVSTQVRANLEIKPSSEEDVPAEESYWLTIDQTNLTSEQIRILISSKFGSQFESTRRKSTGLHG
jgi:spoIIIJ-associated protein